MKEYGYGAPMTPGMSTPPSLSNPKSVIDTLTKMQQAPPPVGTNPQQYQNKLSQAKKIAMTTRPNSPQQAIDMATTQQKAASNY